MINHRQQRIDARYDMDNAHRLAEYTWRQSGGFDRARPRRRRVGMFGLALQLCGLLLLLGLLYAGVVIAFALWGPM